MMSGPWINYHHLFYFKTIAEEGSISLAAKKLLLGQPTLSAQLKQFEDSLRIQLFERQHKKLILTEQGKIALEYAQSIFRMGNEMHDALHDRIVPAKINLQLGALDSIPKQVMQDIAKAAFSKTPCSISLAEGRFDELMRDLSSHKLDLVISNFLPKLETSKGLYHKKISDSSVAWYGSSKYKSLKDGFPESLRNKPVVVPTFDSKLRYDVEHWMKSNNLSVDVIAETQDTSLKKLMATSGMAMIPAAKHAVRREIESGELILIGEIPHVFEQLYFISAVRKISNPLVSDLMESFTL